MYILLRLVRRLQQALRGRAFGTSPNRRLVLWNRLMRDRQALHTLIDELPEPELPAARRFLESLRQQPSDALRLALDAAPLDDEPVSENDLSAIREGFEEQARGETVSHEEVKRLLREAK